jgi:hypothetical protein
MGNGLKWSEAEYAAYLARRPSQPATGTANTATWRTLSIAALQLPGTTTEEELLALVRDLAKTTGWLCYHTHDSRRSEEGYPDVTLTDGDAVLIYELKNNTRKPTEAQERWLQLLAHTGKVETGIWRPRDWTQIVERLTRKRGRDARTARPHPVQPAHAADSCPGPHAGDQTPAAL